MSEASAENDDHQRTRWNPDENPSVDGDQFMAVAVINFAVRTFRKVRAKLRR